MRDRHVHSCLGGNCSCEARDGNTSGDEVAAQAVVETGPLARGLRAAIASIHLTVSRHRSELLEGARP